MLKRGEDFPVEFSSMFYLDHLDHLYHLHHFDHLDDLAQVWSLAEGALVHCLRGHTHAVRYFLICKIVERLNCYNQHRRNSNSLSIQTHMLLFRV